MAWATIAIGGKLAVTAETTTHFLRPVLVGRTYTVEARVTSQTADQIGTSAQVAFGEGKLCAEASATFSILGEAQAVHATGADPTSLDATLLR